MNGTFDAKVIDTSLTTVGANNSPCVKIHVELIKNSVTKDESEAGKTVTATLFLTDKAVEKSVEKLTEVLDWRGTDLTDFDSFGESIFKDKLVKVVLADKVSPTTGKTFTEVKYLNPHGSSSDGYSLEHKPEEAAMLANSLMGKLIAIRKKNGVTPQGAGKPKVEADPFAEDGDQPPF